MAISFDYGSLYNWNAVNTNKLAPIGWHVPTTTEISTLITYLGPNAGNKLKGNCWNDMTLDWTSQNVGANNQYGFNAVPGGKRSYNGVFNFNKDNGFWFCSDDIISNGIIQAGSYDIKNNSPIIFNNYADKRNGASIRCILGKINLPIITTSTASNSSSNNLTCGGNITSDGGDPITSRGVCWSKNANPTLLDSKTVDGSSTGTFSSNITGLTVNTTYHIRAYATNSTCTNYGNDITYKIVPGAPTVITTALTLNVVGASNVGGIVTNCNGADVIERGVYYSKNVSYDNVYVLTPTAILNGTGIGAFAISINPARSTIYYYQAYAKNSYGTGYGAVISFRSY